MSRIHRWFVSLIVIAMSLPSLAQTWHFAVSGDSRNCGDIVVPAIAAGATHDQAQFYWHLGDLRAIYDFDQDIVRRGEHNGERRQLSILDYQRIAWDDYIQHQVAAFGSMPVFVGIGNHELYPPKDRNQFIVQFADWLDSPVLRQQRLADDPNDHRVKTYFHWIQNGVDFIYLDDASQDQFDREQLTWFERIMKHDADDASVKSIVVGMHAALPDSIASGHSMSDWPLGEQSGRRVYQDLLHLQNDLHKHVYALASHSHFLMSDVFNSDYWRAHGGVIPGWIVGTAGAVRYALPPTASQSPLAKTNVYGYLLGTVSPDGSIAFEFKEIKEGDVPASVSSQYPPDAVHDCFVGNTQAK